MKTMKFIFALSSLLFVFGSCAVHKKKENPFAHLTPGVVPINDTLLCDQTEITCFNWLEYRFWLKQVYGDSSSLYRASEPDTSVWNDVPGFQYLVGHYYNHPLYRDYPIIGITQEQAMAFSQWRSDRVFEYYLIQKEWIKYNPNNTPDEHFTIQRFMEGTYPKEDPLWGEKLPENYREQLKFVPNYRLPNSEERTLILGYVDSTDFRFHQERGKDYHKWRAEYLPYQMEILTFKDSIPVFPMRPTSVGAPKHGKRYALLHDIRGNVAEWGAESSITYGGGWLNNVEYILAHDSLIVPEKNPWTGFRNVCVWIEWGKNP